MFYIRKRSVKCRSGVPYEAHLLTTGSDVHVGALGNLGSDTFTYIDTMPHHHKMLAAIAKVNLVNVYQLLDMYMAKAMGKAVTIKIPQTDSHQL